MLFYLENIMLSIFIRYNFIAKVIETHDEDTSIQQDFPLVIAIIRNRRNFNFGPCCHVIYGFICELKSMR